MCRALIKPIAEEEIGIHTHTCDEFETAGFIYTVGDKRDALRVESRVDTMRREKSINGY